MIQGDPVVPVLIHLIVILIAAKVGGDLFERWGQPSVLGELVFGVILGTLAFLGVMTFAGLRTDPIIDTRLLQWGENEVEKGSPGSYLGSGQTLHEGIRCPRSLPMLPIYEIPATINRLFSAYADCFDSPAQSVHFLRYVTSLILPRPVNATVDGINKLFCGSLARNQSSTNRFLTASSWETSRVDTRRIELLKQHPGLRPSAKGGSAIDDVLLEKTGEHSAGVDDLYDPTQRKDILCHCLVTCTYNKLGQSYPVALEPYFTETVCQSEQGKALALVFRTKVHIAIEIVHNVLTWQIPGIFVFDGWYLCQELMKTIEAADRLWVAKGAKDTSVTWRGQAIQLQPMTEQLPKTAYHKVRHNGKVYYCALKVMPVSPFTDKKAVLVCWQEQIGLGEPFSIITNAIWWDATRILLTSFQRWGIEEVHRECKQHQGLAQYQMRTLEGIRKHWSLVACAYAGLTLKRAYRLRGIPHVLTLYSMSMEILMEVAITYIRRIWDTAVKQPEAFLIFKRELEAFYRRFQITVQKPSSAFHMT